MKSQFLIEIGSNKWSTAALMSDSDSYTARIVPESFNGVSCRLDIGSSGLIAANDLSFDVTNAAGTLTRANMKDQFCTIRLIIDRVQSRAWKFIVTDAAEHYGLITVYAEGILNKALRGVYPKTR